MAIIITVIGTVGAIVYQWTILQFLIFNRFSICPMIAIQIADYFVIKESSDKSFNTVNIVIWVIGFALYRYLMLQT